MYGIIATAHGMAASGAYSGLKLVCGAMENIRCVDFIESDSAEMLEEKLKKAYDEVKHYGNVLFIADLMGGTPFTRSVMGFGNLPNVRVLSGLSLPLLYTASITEDDDLDEGVEAILEEAKDGTICYAPPVETEVIEEEDGI